MRATKFEFEQRFWFIGMIYFVGFGMAALDHTNAAIWLLHVAAPAIGANIDPNSDQGNNWIRLIFGAGALVVFLAALLRTWATAYLRTDVVHDMKQHSEGLVADGPYRYLRNPLYFANVPLAMGVGLLASRLGWVVLVTGNLLFAYRLIFREEDGLLQTQGESYREYVKAVPRMWPSLMPRVAAGTGKPRWGQAIAGEMMFWLFGVAELCLAITLNIKVSGILFACSFAFYFLVVPLLVKKGR